MAKVGPAIMRLTHDDVSASLSAQHLPTVISLVGSDALTSIVRGHLQTLAAPKYRR